MKKEKDEELDKLFKNGADDPVNEPVFREADWDAMEQLLDQPKKRGGIIYWLPRLGGVAALLLLFLGWLLFKQPVVKHSDHQQSAIVHSNPDTGTSGGTNRHETADSSKHKILNPAGYAQDPDHPGAGKKTNRSFPYQPVGPAAKLPVNSLGNEPNVLAQANPNNHKPSTEDKKDVGTVDANKIDDNKLASSQVSAADKKDLSTVDANKTNANTLASNPASVPDKKDIGTVNASKPGNSTNGLAANAPKVKAKPVVQPNGANRAIFALSAIASSDMNGTSPLSSGRVGGNFGAMFSVSSGKWTFSTGGMYSIKPYEESFANYHTAYNFQTDPTTVGANCRMIDIPLNVNYQVYNRGINKFTVGTGLSSYIILREDYTFNYANAYYTQDPAGFSVVNKNRNIMSILNLDATYERRINSKFGVVLQPYMKLPLSNVGASEVKLQSTGVAVGLSWNLNSFKKPD